MPVWINVRKEPVPRLAVFNDVLFNARVDSATRITDLFSQGFFIRSVVLSPDAATVLNPNPSSVSGGMARAAMGDHGYVKVDPIDYDAMLRRALERHRDANRPRTAHRAEWLR